MTRIRQRARSDGRFARDWLRSNTFYLGVVRTFSEAAALLVGTCFTSGAFAQGPELVPAVFARDYWKLDVPVLGLDGSVLVGTFLGTKASGSGNASLYVLGEPVHLAENHFDKVDARFAIHVTAPALVLKLASGAGCRGASSWCRSERSDTQTGILTFRLPTASFIDSVSRAREQLLMRTASMRLEPWVDPMGRRYGASVIAAF